MGKREVVDHELIRSLFESIRAAFPHLEASLELFPENVDLELNFPEQPRLPFPVNLNLQGDELHLCVGEGLWLRYYPCDRSEVREVFDGIVRGILTGQMRIVEYLRRGKVVKAMLQEPSGANWETIGSWARTLWPWRLKERVLRNDVGPPAPDRS